MYNMLGLDYFSLFARYLINLFFLFGRNIYTWEDENGKWNWRGAIKIIGVHDRFPFQNFRPWGWTYSRINILQAQAWPFKTILKIDGSTYNGFGSY